MDPNDQNPMGQAGDDMGTPASDQGDSQGMPEPPQPEPGSGIPQAPSEELPPPPPSMGGEEPTGDQPSTS